MSSNAASPARCALCQEKLPNGVRVAFFADQESEESYLGDFCSVAHAFTALDEASRGGDLPETLFLGVRVDRTGHDEEALASVMAEIARRAVREALCLEDDSPESETPPSTLLN